jgi:hypothetical protein
MAVQVGDAAGGGGKTSPFLNSMAFIILHPAERSLRGMPYLWAPLSVSLGSASL